MTKPLPENLACDVCQGESGGNFAGVASLTTGAMSVAFCNKCLAARAEPTFALDYLFVFVAEGNLEALHPSVLQGLQTWVDGRYMPFEEYVKRITPDDVKRQLDEYAEAMNAQPTPEDL